MKTLVNKVQQLTEQSKGTWGIVLEDLNGGKKWELNGDELFYAASVIKVPIMAAVFSAVESEKFALTDQMETNRNCFIKGRR